MAKVLGLDLGTNSIGWAIIDRNDNGLCSLIDRGVHIFQDGVAHDKSGEKPAVQDRTAARSSRRHYFRRRLRKIELLKILIKYNFCPPLSPEELQQWKKEKVYPTNEDFLLWQRTDDNEENNPYHDRFICLTKKLDLEKKNDRLILGRALYHLNQRRGFLSNRKDASSDDESGKVKSSITDLSKEMEAAGCKYLGEYFYKCYGKKKIRTRYTSRDMHYLAEFNAICEKQELHPDLIKQLKKAIFYQRPLKSQKGSVGKCTFEKNKSRCAVSHPRFEEFRMWQFINSIKVNKLEEGFRQLTTAEIDSILPLFFRKSKPNFDFEEIARKIAGKGNYGYQDSPIDIPFKFNYRMTANVPGCPVIAAILNALNIDATGRWEEEVCSLYTKGDGKTTDQIINDIWHALFSFDNDEKLKGWLKNALQLDDKESSNLVKSRIPNGYASLSLKAINKILPWLKKEHIYSHAVFLANIPSVLPNISEERIIEVEENVKALLEDFSKNPLNRVTSTYKAVADYLIGVTNGVDISKLYHPSMIDVYQCALPDASGKIRLASPRTNAFKNPMALRALFRLRALINQLLDERLIDKETKINIEFARGLNDTNKRKAIESYQRELEKQREKDRAELIETFKNEFGKDIDPSDDDLLKYQLYQEQGHKCLYTGNQIGLSSFLGTATEYDIEHTIPRSLGGDNSQMNKTLCSSRFNRFVKKAKIPSALANHSEILQRVAPWKDKVEEFEKQIAYYNKKKNSASTKDEKDKAIQQIHLLNMKRDYWKGKYERFTMTTIPEGFSNRQGVDIGIIGKYARLYLKTVFDRIYIVKGATTAQLRREWGLQKEYTKKERVNHAHHCIDAVTIACIGKKEYDTWKEYMLREENHLWNNGEKPVFPKPWPTFTEDVLHIPDNLIVSHYTPDNMFKKSRKKLRVKGIVQHNKAGEIMYCQGDTARGLLHKDTVYGAIKKGDDIRYVIRKSLDTLDDKDVKNIVDDTVREIILSACKEYGNLKKAVAAGIWMNKEKKIPIQKVRLFAPTVTNPLHLKKHRDLSIQAHKQFSYVANDSNYCMAVYGVDKPGFKLFTIMDAATLYQDEGGIKNWIPSADEKNRPLRCILKVGTMVLFYEKNPEELLTCSQKELSKRLYKVTGLSSMTIQKKYNYGTVSLKHHQEARVATELKGTNGVWKNDDSYRAIINLYHTQLTCLTEGYDFELTTSGHIVFKNKA